MGKKRSVGPLEEHMCLSIFLFDVAPAQWPMDAGALKQQLAREPPPRANNTSRKLKKLH